MQFSGNDHVSARASHVLNLMGICLATILAGTLSLHSKRDQNYLDPGALSIPARVSTPIPSTYFGMHVHRLAKETRWPEVPIGSIRLHDAEYVSWATIEPKRGKWDFGAFDKNVNEASRHDAEILYTLGQTPTWSAALKSADSAYGIPGTSSYPSRYNDWRNYVETVAKRYKGRIKSYEIWNEASAPNFYSGPVSIMVELSRIAYETLKKVDPSITVVSPSGTGDDGLKWYDEFLRLGGGKYCDVLAYHFYHHGMSQTPESIGYMVETISKSMRAYGVSKPIWDTEMFYGPDRPDYQGERGAALVARGYIMHWVYGIERFYWYSWDNKRNGMQMLDPFGNLTDAARAYGEIQKILVGSKMIEVTSNSEGTWTATLRRPTGANAYLIWNIHGGKVIRLPKDIAGATQTRILGRHLQIESNRQINVGIVPTLIE